MLFFEAFLTTIGTVISYGIIFTIVFKLFQIATELNEMKELLRDMKRHFDVNSMAPSQPLAPTSAEELVRAIHSGAFVDTDSPALDPK